MSNTLETNNITEDFISNIKNNLTKASFFVKNMLGYNISFWDEDTYLNTYIGLDPDCMYICFLNNPNPKQTYMLNTLSDNPNWICKYENKDFVVCKLGIPINFSDDLHKIIDGKYSQTSEDYKDQILRLNCKLSRKSFDKIKNGLYVTKSAIKELEERLGAKIYVNEVISKPDLDKELFNPYTFNLEDGKV